ncbi:MAG: GNAT family N-acetyltransferase [Streptococcaceae bacterium]|jgi:GNAT superfamily N-acetyltransferase|nr:GNAT family N-acetyltransferase [Streptococcaceae bacterium]
MKIEKTNSPVVIANLLEIVQTKHHELLPDVFKPFDFDSFKSEAEKTLEESGQTFYVATIEGQYAGIIWLHELPEKDNLSTYARQTLKIEALAVLPEFQGMGIGTELLNYAEQVAKAQQIERLLLANWLVNDVATFYQDKGYQTFLSYQEKWL